MGSLNAYLILHLYFYADMVTEFPIFNMVYINTKKGFYWDKICMRGYTSITEFYTCGPLVFI